MNDRILCTALPCVFLYSHLVTFVYAVVTDVME